MRMRQCDEVWTMCLGFWTSLSVHLICPPPKTEESPYLSFFSVEPSLLPGFTEPLIGLEFSRNRFSNIYFFLLFFLNLIKYFKSIHIIHIASRYLNIYLIVKVLPTMMGPNHGSRECLTIIGINKGGWWYSS